MVHFSYPLIYIETHSIFRSTDWIRIATEIELNYATFDAFVVLHGTDTMSYTSSALGFLLEDLGKTVVSLNQIVTFFAYSNPKNRLSLAHRSRYHNSEMMRLTIFLGPLHWPDTS